MNRRLSLFCLLLLPLLLGSPVSGQAPVRQPNAGAVNIISLEVFFRGDSETSKRAVEFASQLAAKTDGLEVVAHDVLTDQAQLSRLWTLARRAGRDKPVAPAFYSCGRIHFGFNNADATRPAIENLLTADVYTRSTCPKCQAAKRFFSALSPQWPALRFRIYEITNDPIARRRYQDLCRSKGKLPGLPTIHFASQVIVGYQGDQITGAEFLRLLQSVAQENRKTQNTEPSAEETSFWQRRRISPEIRLVSLQAPDQATRSVRQVQGSAEPAQVDEVSQFDEVPLPAEASQFDEVPLPDQATSADIETAELTSEGPLGESAQDAINVPLLGELRASNLGLPLFTLLVGLVDGFNPCAMWILVFLLSVLVNIKDRRKILLIAGTFVVVSGVAYFAFMTAWLNLFLLIGIARPAQIILGLFALLIGIVNVKDFFAFKKGISFSIPESSKPGIYRRVREIVAAKYLTTALVGVVTLAVVVNMVELLCTAGLPALYTQVLTMHELPAWKNYGYLGLYTIAYMFDDTVLLTIVVITLSNRRLQEREGRWLKLLSGLAILAIGLVMIFKPEWLQLGQ